jgi:hypothetical protein
VLEANVMQNTSPPITAAAERKRLATYLKKSILKKKYNYIFTGLNDQVINFDIKLNNAYATSLARMNGIYVNSAMADKSMVYQDNAAEEATFTYKLNAVANFQNTGTSLRASDNQIDKFEEAKAKLAAATQTPAQVRLRDLLLSKQKPKDMLAFLNQVQNSGGLTVEGELTEPLPFAKSLATPLAGTDIKFISDVNTSEESIKEAYNDYLLGIKGKLRPVTYIDSMHQQQIGQGITSNSNSGIQQVSTMFAVALHSNIDSSFMHIHLTIKGDPFWLFPQPVVDDDARLHNALKPEAEAIEWIKEAHMKTRDSVNIYGSDNFLLLRFRTPRIFDTNDNPDTTNPFTDVEMLSGVFKVTEITHKFESGKFTQDIACYLDTQINITNFTNEIENDAAVPTPETTTAEATIDSIPPTASKTQKLAKPSALDKIKNKVNGAVANVTSAAKGVTDKASALAAEGMAKAPNIGVVISTNTPQPLPSPIQGLPPKYD